MARAEYSAFHAYTPKVANMIQAASTIVRTPPYDNRSQVLRPEPGALPFMGNPAPCGQVLQKADIYIFIDNET
jgi:hypothetical protein